MAWVKMSKGTKGKGGECTRVLKYRFMTRHRTPDTGTTTMTFFELKLLDFNIYVKEFLLIFVCRRRETLPCFSIKTFKCFGLKVHNITVYGSYHLSSFTICFHFIATILLYF